MQDSVAIEVLGLHRTFRNFWQRQGIVAVEDVSFRVPRGHVFALLGPNGSGKSTTLKMILGLLRPTHGQVRLFGKAVITRTERAQIGYLPEETYLYEWLTAEESLVYSARLFGLNKQAARERAEQLLRMVGLVHARDRQVGGFSKGMARRIGLAQALIHDPELIILDEPTSGLDPIGCFEVKQLILDLKKRGKTILICSHDLDDVETVADEAVIMYGGKVQAVGTLEQLLTDRQRQRLEFESKDPAIAARLQAFIAQEFPELKQDWSHPSARLETLFLDLVESARKAGKQSAGAAQSGELAAFFDENKGRIREELLTSLKEIPQPTVPAQKGQRIIEGLNAQTVVSDENRDRINRKLKDLL